MIGAREITLLCAAVLLTILGIVFPLRDFPKRLLWKHLFFHIAFAFVVVAEVAILEKYKFFNGIFLNLDRVSPAIRILFCIVTLDLLSYFWHRLNHNASFLWRWHKFHHQTETMDPMAAYRFHPVEVFFGYQLRSAVIWLLGFRSPEISAFVLSYGLLNLFQHSNLRLPQPLERLIGQVFVTPALHHMHHLKDRASQNSNYATILILWDRLFRSRTPPGAIRENDIGLEWSSK